jgi:RimJ/RimL family protein N-acetyltransferase
MDSVDQVGPLVDDGRTAQLPLEQYEGVHVILKRLQPNDAPSLFESTKMDRSLWTYMQRSADDLSTLEMFQDYVDFMSKSEEPCVYSIKLRSNLDDVVGHIALMSFNRPNRVNEIGHVLLSPKLKKSTAATEVFYLMMKASFEQLNSRRVEWKTNVYNQASRKAALRLGFTYEGIFRNHMIVKGHSRDSIYFSIIESEWPARKQMFEAWLHPSNYGANGQQIKNLTQLYDEQQQQHQTK